MDTGDDDVEIRRIQPYQARKVYRCPGCDHEISVGVGHLVVVPPEAPGERRHWHGACWEFRYRRRLPERLRKGPPGRRP